MNKLAHLPEHKQEELAEIVQIIKSIANPEKIILFGSHTSDKWIEDQYIENGVTYSYISDYDILVVLSAADREHEIASKIENRTLKFKNDVSPLVYTMDYINKGLESGQYFFRDIVRKGIILFDTNRLAFSECKPLTTEQERILATQHFENWIGSGSRFLDGTTAFLQNALNKGYDLNEVIFNLNQSAEKFYGGVLLVYTGYKPKTHKLKVYRKYSKYISEELNRVFMFPYTDVDEYRLFDLLNKSYLDARYQDNYKIDLVDLEKLILKVKQLEQISIRLCKEKISTL